MYLIRIYKCIIFFNNFLLTRQSLKRLSFSLFVLVLAREQISFPIRFVNAAAPSPTPKTAGPRASASPTTPSHLVFVSFVSFFDPELFQVHN